MAIKTDDSSISVNFVYHDDDLDEDFIIKLHGVDEIGRAISVHGNARTVNDNGMEYISFPAQLMVEAVDFLRNQGYLKLGGASATAPSLSHGTQISLARTSRAGVLPMPDLRGQTVAPVQDGGILPGPRLHNTMPPGPPLQSLSASGPASNENALITDDGDYVVEEEYEDEEEIEMEPVDEQKISTFQKIAAERQAAAERVGTAEPKVARPTRVDYGQQIKEKIEKQADAEYEDYIEV